MLTASKAFLFCVNLACGYLICERNGHEKRSRTRIQQSLSTLLDNSFCGIQAAVPFAFFKPKAMPFAMSRAVFEIQP